MEDLREKVYSRINWENEPAVTSPINATNLNRMDYALNEIDGRVISLDTAKSEEAEVLPMIANVTYNETTGKFTFARKNGETIEADLNIEKIPVSFSMSEAGVITMRTSDGTYYTADVASLIKLYNFVDSDQLNFTRTVDSSGNYSVTAEVINGSITEEKLQPNFLATIRTYIATVKSDKDYVDELVEEFDETYITDMQAINLAKSTALNAIDEAKETAVSTVEASGAEIVEEAAGYKNQAKQSAEDAQYYAESVNVSKATMAEATSYLGG